MNNPLFLYEPLKNLIKRIIFFLKWNPYQLISYSQEGEDIMLERLFDYKKKGFFVDIGAHHPIRFSNTYKLYCAGWRGINIDAMPGSMEMFDRIRPQDVNIESPIFSSAKEVEYYVFSEPALNGFDKNLSSKRSLQKNITLLETKILKGDRLSNLLSEHESKFSDIDFMNIDVEGFEIEVLMSNNWSKYRPKVILIEILDFNIYSNPVYKYLTSVGYMHYGRSKYTNYFVENNFQPF